MAGMSRMSTLVLDANPGCDHRTPMSALPFSAALARVAQLLAR